MNIGKVFEADYIKSLPSNVFSYRLRDSAATWQGGSNTRFATSNICDFIVFTQGTLYLLELKSHKGKSIPLTCIKLKHLVDMVDAEKYHGVKSYIVFNFSTEAKTYQVKASDILEFYQAGMRKSIPISFIEEHGQLIEQELKKTHYKYNLEGVY